MFEKQMVSVAQIQSVSCDLVNLVPIFWVLHSSDVYPSTLLLVPSCSLQTSVGEDIKT